jgi:hypothetical protein
MAKIFLLLLYKKKEEFFLTLQAAAQLGNERFSVHRPKSGPRNGLRQFQHTPQCGSQALRRGIT